MSDADHGLQSPTSTASLAPRELKTWSQKSWKEKRKTKFCGIPFGWILLVVGVVLFIVIVLSAAIGGFMSAQEHHNKKHNKQK